MPDPAIVTQLPLLSAEGLGPKPQENPSKLHRYWQHPETQPAAVANTPALQRYIDLLGPLDWAQLPERNLHRHWGQPTIPYAAFIAFELFKLNEGLPSMGETRQHLLEQPGFIPLFGFPCVPAFNTPVGFNAPASLPTTRHCTHMLRALPQAVLQHCLTQSVQLIRRALADYGPPALNCVSLDTKHIVAGVKENNPKTAVPQRFDATQQPPGDPDCRLGCKRQRNQYTPTRAGQPASRVAVGEYYWGYASGVVVTKVPGLGEFVVAELTQPFDQGDLTYFFPLLAQVEARLGYRPRFATFDAAFDAWYVYAYFYRGPDPNDGMAAVPLAKKGGCRQRAFAANGAPLCRAGLPMHLQFTFVDRTSCLVPHERAKYGCPLRFPTRTASACPSHAPAWRHGGCMAMMPTSIGARLRYTLDRHSELYRSLYRQRSAVERINSQAVNLGIERPHLRNGAAIANQNTLIYLLINLRFLQRLRRRERETD